MRFRNLCCGSALASMRIRIWIQLFTQCGSGSRSSCLPQCGFGPREPNQFGCMRIRNRVRLSHLKKLDYTWKIYLLHVSTRYVVKHTNVGRLKCLFVNFGQFPCSWILIQVPNTDPDPRKPNQCWPMRIGSTTLFRNIRMRIRKRQVQGKTSSSYVGRIPVGYYI